MSQLCTIPTNRPNFKNLTDRQFGKWTVIGYVGGPRGKWLCRCKCGNEVIVFGGNLRRNLSTQCQKCANSEFRSLGVVAAVESGASSRNFKKAVAAAKLVVTTHGQCVGAYRSVGKTSRRSSTYKSWEHMRSRCYWPKNIRFDSYGAVGVTVCDRWRYSLENFIADLGERPAGTSLGRRMDMGNYEPGNCWWQTPKEQAEQRRLKREFLKNAGQGTA